MVGSRRDNDYVQFGEKDEMDAKRLPLNSRRLKVSHLRVIARTLDLPTMTASTDDLRAMIEGKLTEGGKQPMNVLVILEDDDTISLSDEEGTFLTGKAQGEATPLAQGHDEEAQVEDAVGDGDGQEVQDDEQDNRGDGEATEVERLI